MRLPEWLRKRLFYRMMTVSLQRDPDFVIGTQDDPYMRRWWILPRNRFFNVYLHQLLRDDDDRALHDHPWPSCSIILSGGYVEVMPVRGGDPAHGPFLRERRLPGQVTFRGAWAAHRLEVVRDGVTLPYSWSLFITGPRLREWGFHCPRGWKRWQDFTRAGSPGEIGPGCD